MRLVGVGKARSSRERLRQPGRAGISGRFRAQIRSSEGPDSEEVVVRSLPVFSLSCHTSQGLSMRFREIFIGLPCSKGHGLLLRAQAVPHALAIRIELQLFRLELPDALQDAGQDVAGVHVVHADAVDVLQVPHLSMAMPCMAWHGMAAGARRAGCPPGSRSSPLQIARPGTAARSAPRGTSHRPGGRRRSGSGSPRGSRRGSRGPWRSRSATPCGRSAGAA